MLIVGSGRYFIGYKDRASESERVSSHHGRGQEYRTTGH